MNVSREVNELMEKLFVQTQFQVWHDATEEDCGLEQVTTIQELREAIESVDEISIELIGAGKESLWVYLVDGEINDYSYSFKQFFPEDV